MSTINKLDIPIGSAPNLASKMIIEPMSDEQRIAFQEMMKKMAENDKAAEESDPEEYLAKPMSTVVKVNGKIVMGLDSQGLCQRMPDCDFDLDKAIQSAGAFGERPKAEYVRMITAEIKKHYEGKGGVEIIEYKDPAKAMTRKQFGIETDTIDLSASGKSLSALQMARERTFERLQANLIQGLMQQQQNQNSQQLSSADNKTSL